MKISIIKKHFIIVSENLIGQRVDNFLFKYLKNVPKSAIYRFIRKGKVRVNKNKIEPRYKMQYKDVIFIPEVKIINNNSISAKLNKINLLNNLVLYEDSHILAINKPSGIAVHGGSGLNFGVIEGFRILRPNNKFLELVHRLDKNSSGVLLIAKKRSTLIELHNQLRTRNIKKEYLALVKGKWNPKLKSINAPILKRRYNNKRFVEININGKFSQTYFNIEEEFITSTLIRAFPVTGRTHQIRIHALYAGCPIAFDERYGDPYFDKQMMNCGLDRLFLHAKTLRFKHPNIDKEIEIIAPLDNSLNECLDYLRRFYK